MNTETPHAFLITGGVASRKVMVNADAEFRTACRAGKGTGEAYLSAFQYGPDMPALMARQRGSVARYGGIVGSQWLWFDIDRDDPATALALADARRLVASVLARYPEWTASELLVFFSGSKGYHVGVPLAHKPPASGHFHRACRCLAERLAGAVAIDRAVYSAVQPFRRPNSQHPKTGRYKRRLTAGQLARLSAGRIRELATRPRAFIPTWPAVVPSQLAKDWQWADAEGMRAHRPVRPRGTTEAKGAIGNLASHGDDLARFFAFDIPADLPALLTRVATQLRAAGATKEQAAFLLTESATTKGMAPSAVAKIVGRADQRLPKFLSDALTFGVETGARHQDLFRSAASLAESGLPDAVIAAVLSWRWLEAGLPADDVARQIECGINHGRRAA